MKIKFILNLFLSSIISSTLVAQCGYQLVWEDEFSGSSLDLNTWSHQTGAGGWGNGELQNYTSSTANSYVQNDKLHITALEPSNGVYTSARLRSINNGDWTYGKMEARIKLPYGQGIWPAFWMMPTDNVYGGWPSSGEIDIMEYLGHQTNVSYGTCHYGNAWNDKGSSGTSYTLPSGNYHTSWHDFSIEWAPNVIRWYVDGNLYHTATPASAAPYAWPFDQDFHFILNIAVGGAWPGYPDASTVFPQTMEVEYVRVWQNVDDAELKGEELLAPNTSGTSYSFPDIPNATYHWSIPACATLVSGQGTHEIIVDWLNGGGDITLYLDLACGSYEKTLTVDLTNNIWDNSGFENNMAYWNTYQAGGSIANFFLTSSGVYAGQNSLCVNVQQIGNNFWDTQLAHTAHPVSAGVPYTLSFYAKADQPGSEIAVYFRNTANNSTDANVTFYIGTFWAYYQYTFIPTYNIADVSADINMSFETGVFCFDEVRLVGPGPSTVSCCQTDLVHSTALTGSGNYNRDNGIYSSSAIDPNLSIGYEAGNEVSLEEGFCVPASSTFTAEIQDCY